MRIVTESGNEGRDMISLNLANGFDIIGTGTDQKGALKLIMAKNL